MDILADMGAKVEREPDGVVVVDTDEVTLIGDKLHMGDIKKILENLRNNEIGKKYL